MIMKKDYQNCIRKLLSLLLSFLILTTTVVAYALSYDELLEKAEEYANAGDYDKAFACYDLAIKEEPGYTAAYLRAGLLHLVNGEIPEARRCIDFALDLDSTSTDAWLIKCLIDIANEDVSALDSDVLYAEICGADLSECAALIGELYAKSGYEDKAIQYFSMVSVEELNDSQKELYHRCLLTTGKEEKSVCLIVCGYTNSELLDAYLESIHNNEFPDVDQVDLVSVAPGEYSEMQMLVYFEANEGDLYILPRETFIAFAYEGTLLPLEDDSQLQTVLGNKMDYGRGWRSNQTGELHLFGIPVDQLCGLEPYAQVDGGFLCVDADANNPENAKKLLRIICRDMQELSD